jgi:hypothetical protein
MISVFGWPDTSGSSSENYPTTLESSGSAASIVHSSLLCPGLIVAFLSYHHKYSPSAKLFNTNDTNVNYWRQEFVDALLQFCTGYMIYDFLFIILLRLDPTTSMIPNFRPDDYLFMGHHIATIYLCT